MRDDGGGRPSWRTVSTGRNDSEDILPRVGEIKVTIAHVQIVDAAGAEDGLRDRGRQAIGNHDLIGARVDIETVDDTSAEIAHEETCRSESRVIALRCAASGTSVILMTWKSPGVEASGSQPFRSRRQTVQDPGVGPEPKG